jgi:hypothetical protein
LAWESPHAGYVRAAFGKTLEADLAERIVADGGAEANFIPERREIMGEDG